MKPLSAMLPALFAKLATCVDPFIYTLSQPKIRTQVLLRLHLLPHTNYSSAPYYHPGLANSHPHFNSRIGVGSHRDPISGFHRSTADNYRSPSLIDGNYIRDVETNVEFNRHQQRIVNGSNSPNNSNIQNTNKEIGLVDALSVKRQRNISTLNNSDTMIPDAGGESGDQRPIIVVEQHPAPGVGAITTSDLISNSAATVCVCIPKETLV